MARIVPAKPKLRIQAQKDILWRLQDVTSDDFIIFQNKPVAGGCIVLKPGALALFLYITPPTSKFDPDACCIFHEDGASEDIDEVAEAALEMLASEGVALGAVALIGNQITSGTSVVSLEDGDLPLIGMSSVEDAADGLQLDGGVTVGQIQAFLAKTVPGSSPYEPGTVTGSQAKLRGTKEALQVSSPRDDRALEDEILKEIERDDVDLDEVREQIEEVEDAPVPPMAVTKPVRLPSRAQPFQLNMSSTKRVLHLERMIDTYLDALKRDRQLFSFGVEVESDFVTSSEGMLPALLIAASEEWTPVVVAAKGHAAFDIRMAKDPEALIGFRIVDVLVSTPSVLYMPLAHMLRKCFDGEGYVLDSVIERFGRWVQKYDLENTEIDDIGMHIALKALEADS
ncbi:hypothetical protein [Sulfitobacter sp. R18_1]|uniref:hypothetical protein n=1 Tax=Sulfitobacter sp. R18_1 TaxID=2821104 RepID=UPI001ADBE8BA|nr:hypothetical protein [Sulfitobacter sp. R18_1]MBO9428412.1 hypothetical protein [Sulfitobacter sp. R18_1]